MTIPWSDEKDDKLKILLDARVSIARIAKVLGVSPEAIKERRLEIATKEPSEPQPEVDQIEYMRETLTPIAFAEKILSMHGKIETIRDQHYINGKPSTPAVKIEEASRALIALGRKPIRLRR